MDKEMIRNAKGRLLSIVISVLMVTSATFAYVPGVSGEAVLGTGVSAAAAADFSIPEYSGSAYVLLNDGEPSFDDAEKQKLDAFEQYSELDSLGRCGVAYANICPELMPTEDRGDISSIHPTGWRTGAGYDRCHLIGFQLAGENANARNLITGTHYFNVSGMLPFENMIDDYVDETGNHVLYRVTPVFSGDELVARGVQMEAWSVEDAGEGICFNVFCFNVFKDKVPEINYATGDVADTIREQVIEVKTSSKTYTVQKNLAKKSSFSMGITSSTGNKVCTKKAGSKRLSVSKNGTVYVQKGTPIGKYTMSVKIYAEGSDAYTSKTIYQTVTVRVAKKSAAKPAPGVSGTVYWTATGSCYHKTKACRSLSRSRNIYSGPLSKAKNMGLRACKNCC